MSILLLLMAFHLVLPKVISSDIVRLPNEHPRPILLPHQTPDFWNPWRVPDNHPGNYVYTIMLNYQPYQPTRFAVYPTGCVEGFSVNGKEVSIESGRCSRDFGFVLDLQPYLQQGTNEIKIMLATQRTYRGSRPYDTATYGMQFAPVMSGFPLLSPANIILSLLLASTCAFLILLTARFTGEYAGGFILSFGLLIFLHQLQATSYMAYTIDMPSHYQYICFISSHGYAPKPVEGWEYYHPATYYQIAAHILLFCNWLGSFDAVTSIRLFSIFCFMTFLFFATLVLHRMISNRIAYGLSLLMLACYPSGIVYAPRIDSHLPLYALYSACVYFLMRWVDDGRIRYCWLALSCFGVAAAVRSNALLLVPLIGLTGLYQCHRKQFTIHHALSLGMLISLSIIATGMMLNFGRTAHFHQVDNNAMPYVVGNIYAIQPNQRIQTTAAHLFEINMQQLFNPPYVDWWHDHTGRQYFLDSVIKMSLFEHFWWHAWGLAQRLIGLLMAAIAYILATLCWMRPQKRKEWAMCSLSLILALLMLMANRVAHPYAPSQDFRYIYPAIASFCALLGLTVEQHIARRYFHTAIAGCVLIMVFVWTSLWLIYTG